MTPEIAVERVRLYLKWCARHIDDLDSGNAPVAGAVGWRRNGETWLPASTWREIFDETEADEAAAELNRNGFLRTPDGPGLQIIVKVRNKTHRVYAIKKSIVEWKPQDADRGYERGYRGHLSGQGTNSTPPALPVPISLPPPPTFPENFNELSPAERQNYLLATAMNLQSHLLSLSLKLAPEDAKGIAQLAAVAQAVVGNSIKLDQINVEREDSKKKQERVAEIIAAIKGRMDELGRA
jgi:hypothetical protein